jgi:regulator of replication initiation timing
MGNVNERHNDIGDDALSRAKGADVGSAEIPVNPSGPVIELGDLTTGPEADVNQLKSDLGTLREEMKQIRGQHAGLASEYQKLNQELRDIKLVLAKAHAKELAAIEGRSSWAQSVNRLREVFQVDSSGRK